jgi:hypothetical protein
MYADPIKPVTLGSLVVTVNLLVRRTVISNDVYEILYNVLNARMVSICTDLCATDGCNNKGDCITSADGYFGDQYSELSYLLYSLFILEIYYAVLLNLYGGRI